jgi:hypothetical protein
MRDIFGCVPIKGDRVAELGRAKEIVELHNPNSYVHFLLSWTSYHLPDKC